MEEDNVPYLLTASYDSTIKFWSVARPTWDCSQTVDLPEKVVINRMEISNDKLNLACATTQGVKLYDLSPEADLANVRECFLGENVVNLVLERDYQLSGQCDFNRI